MFWLATTEVRSGSSILGDCSVWYRPVPTFAYRESLVKSAKNSCILFSAEVSVSLCLFSSEFFQPIMRPVVSGFFTSVSFDTYKLNTSLRACYFLKMNSALWWGELNASSHFLWNTSLCLGDGFSKGCGQTKYDLFGAVYLFFFLSVSATWTLDHRTGRFPCLILGFFSDTNDCRFGRRRVERRTWKDKAARPEPTPREGVPLWERSHSTGSISATMVDFYFTALKVE